MYQFNLFMANSQKPAMMKNTVFQSYQSLDDYMVTLFKTYVTLIHVLKTYSTLPVLRGCLGFCIDAEIIST